MKRYSWAIACTTVMMAFAVTAVLAKQPAGQARGRAPAPPAPTAHNQFDEHDRQATRTWFDAHQQNPPAGFRSRDRFTPAVETQFHAGYVIDRGMRGQSHSLPSTLLRMLAPAPHGNRYMVINGHVVMIDSGYRVVDVIHVGHGG